MTRRERPAREGAGAAAHPATVALLDPPPAASRGRAALSGVVATGLALGITELAAGLLRSVPSLVLSIADRVIGIAPAPVLRLAVDIFSTNDKPFLIAVILLCLVLIGARLGRAAAARPVVIPAGFGVLGLLGIVAAAGETGVALPLVALTTVVAAAAGAAALRALLRVAAVTPGASPASAGGMRDRREFLVVVASVVVAGTALALSGRSLVGRVAAAARDLVRLPRPVTPAPPVPEGAELNVPGISPLVTPNGAFYRIDTALVAPQLDPSGWTLRVTGMVDNPFELSFAQLLALPMVEEYVTLTCVSNEVGGGLAGNARWLGVPLPQLLARARVRAGANQVVGRAVDGFTVGVPTEAVLDGRTALVAVGMNGVPLPFEHGFPARLVVAGLYGYVSATKWLTEIQLTTFDAFTSFWAGRGWSQRAPIKTESRIDVPRDGQSVGPGPTAIAGVAWSRSGAVSRVEVSIDGGAWRQAALAAPIGIHCWRQWSLAWAAPPPGSHTIAVRATDAGGSTQTEVVQAPPPDGATGYHTIQVHTAA